jgi:hypothetical protein
MNDDEAYRAFLLRAWQVDNGGEPVWRYSLQAASDSAVHVFRVANELVAFLGNQDAGGQSVPPAEDRGSKRCTKCGMEVL